MTEPPSTRRRLLQAGRTLFAAGGYRGASVRDICDLAGANPGAVSYHFGGKRQLYRAVLRQALERLAGDLAGLPAAASPNAVAGAILRRMAAEPELEQLLLRDVADGAEATAEALAPLVRRAREALARLQAGPDEASATTRRLLAVAAPLVLLTAGWPLVHRTLNVPASERETWLRRLLEPETVAAEG